MLRVLGPAPQTRHPLNGLQATKVQTGIGLDWNRPEAGLGLTPNPPPPKPTLRWPVAMGHNPPNPPPNPPTPRAWRSAELAKQASAKPPGISAGSVSLVFHHLAPRCPEFPAHPRPVPRLVGKDNYGRTAFFSFVFSPEKRTTPRKGCRKKKDTP